jgi:hypothetical protein
MRSLVQELVLGDANHFQFEVTSETLLPSFNQQKNAARSIDSLLGNNIVQHLRNSVAGRNCDVPDPSFDNVEGAAATFLFLALPAKPFPAWSRYVAVGVGGVERYRLRFCILHRCFQGDFTRSQETN